jgi:hypothetical protein
VSEKPYEVLKKELNGAARSAKPTLPELDRKPDPWEGSMQATCECLSWRGALDNLDRRRAEDELGETVYGDFPVHARSAVVTAHVLLDKGIITEAELEAKMAQVRERLAGA